MRNQLGFTIVELLMVMVVLGVISAYAVMKGVSPGEATLNSQAQKMASDIRHAQTLATTWGRSLRISAAGSTYSVSCKTASTTPPCNESPVIDPATGVAFTRKLENISFSAVPNPSLTFNSLGQPDAAALASYTLSSGTSTNTVTVEAITGKVTP